MKTRLTWYLAVCLSLVLILVSYQWGLVGRILARDATFISAGIVAIYLGLTLWVGVSIHSGASFPLKWVRWFVEAAPVCGLIGTVIGLVMLFGLGGGGSLNEQAIFNGVGTALFTTLCGMVFSAFMQFQIVVLKR